MPEGPWGHRPTVEPASKEVELAEKAYVNLSFSYHVSG
jgi:hypothetical protein